MTVPNILVIIQTDDYNARIKRRRGRRRYDSTANLRGIGYFPQTDSRMGIMALNQIS